MKLSEMFDYIAEGGAVRRSDWESGEYMYMDDDGDLLDEDGEGITLCVCRDDDGWIGCDIGGDPCE